MAQGISNSAHEIPGLRPGEPGGAQRHRGQPGPEPARRGRPDPGRQVTPAGFLKK
ncbi:MAG: hypothetical protein M0C28_33135 [Candidatus Moduliflexus flocculans]|nr:hypothetical protein [Candidatus Moduliflexus flocculans]